jgi:hypothetical protein
VSDERKERKMKDVRLLGEYVGPVSHLCRLRHPVVLLSTGRPIMVGRYSYSSRITESLDELSYEDWTPLSRDEEDESWNLVGRYDEIVGLLPEERPTYTERSS